MREPKLLDYALLTILALIWSSAFFNIKIATYSYGPITIAFLRVFFGTIPLTKFLLPEEDSITSNSKQLALNRQNLKKIDSEIAKLSKVVKSSLNIRAIEKLL